MCKDHVYCVGFYTHGQLIKKPHPVLESTYRIGIGLDTSLIQILAISYWYTDSSGGILIYSRYPSKLRWWLIHLGMSWWYVAHLTTYLDLGSVFKIQRSGMTVHCILHQWYANKRIATFSKLCFPRHGLWYLPPPMKLSEVKIVQRKPW